MRYGNDDCEHEEVVYRTDGWEEGCVPAVCYDCGAFGCFHDSDLEKKAFFDKGVAGNANVNGKWSNPYVSSSDEKGE